MKKVCEELKEKCRFEIYPIKRMLKILEKTRLNHIVFQKIGKVSYSIYIVHFIFAYHLLPEKKEFIWLIPYLLLTFLLSYFISVLMERYIEKPFIRLGAKLTSS